MAMTHCVQELVRVMRDSDEGVEVCDRRWRMRRFRKCFVGSELVDWILTYYAVMDYTSTMARARAVALGQMLMDQGLFAHVVDPEKPFLDEKLFYSFAPVGADELIGCVANLGGEDIEGPTDMELIDIAVRALNIDPALFGDDGSAAQESPVNEAEARDREIKLLADTFAKHPPVEIKDRKYRLRTYKQCFLGSELIDWLCVELKCSRPKALSVAKRMENAEIFAHVVGDHKIKDEPLFYHVTVATGDSTPDSTLYDFSMDTLFHEPFDFGALRGKVVIVTNVASF
ncbi:uncharacterized protein AMSG_12157 [Thecamonas trahens ATCC 50062]|uniref:DEP domain-containing protein n=1 Tax=Thecamonas trahens ATCC 50062 TaxID=461836 RepID=A0A0L0DJ84_THETB|nr:hypothetical protein AMSG_12157 [Thecamonas trahens ATCC 50062]KNC52367.1 hypothetical protein AMSG_12157 [Thecamonas trahens ATCC 50062]|eukprot:XP_013755497.1 hypothetical protein AMSG_12157 [Thecamonas trahens ATCC 50062]